MNDIERLDKKIDELVDRVDGLTELMTRSVTASETGFDKVNQIIGVVSETVTVITGEIDILKERAKEEDRRVALDEMIERDRREQE